MLCLVNLSWWFQVICKTNLFFFDFGQTSECIRKSWYQSEKDKFFWKFDGLFNVNYCLSLCTFFLWHWFHDKIARLKPGHSTLHQFLSTFFLRVIACILIGILICWANRFMWKLTEQNLSVLWLAVISNYAFIDDFKHRWELVLSKIMLVFCSYLLFLQHFLLCFLEHINCLVNIWDWSVTIKILYWWYILHTYFLNVKRNIWQYSVWL